MVNVSGVISPMSSLVLMLISFQIVGFEEARQIVFEFHHFGVVGFYSVAVEIFRRHVTAEVSGGGVPFVGIFISVACIGTTHHQRDKCKKTE